MPLQRTGVPYTLLDLDEKDERKLAALVSRFEASENIVRVRLIENPNLF